MAESDDSRERDAAVLAGDSDRYQLDSESDSDGYQAETGSDGEGDLVEGIDHLVDSWKSMKEGWWNQAGYETYWDYVKETEAKWARMGSRSIFSPGRKRPTTEELPDPSPVDIDLQGVAADATRPRRARDRQVNVRLTELGYRALREAANSFGLRPTTLARLLIHRGAIAVLEDQKADSD